MVRKASHTRNKEFNLNSCENCRTDAATCENAKRIIIADPSEPVSAYDVWLSERLVYSPSLAARLTSEIGSARDIYNTHFEETVQWLKPSERARLNSKSLETAYGVLACCEKNRISLLRYGSKGYPERLSGIPSAPYLLYVNGTLPDIDGSACAGIVGTRNMSADGMEAAYRISYELAAAGAVIVSGMAKGIDGVAACAALDAGGKTVAVIGCGTDIIYPREHEKLMYDILSGGGAVVSEYPPHTPPDATHFPARNRIISGLSNAVLVVEAGIKSGAVITAEDALSQNRRVYAVPGRITDANCEGSNRLLRGRAAVALGAADIAGGLLEDMPDSLDTDALARASSVSGPAPGALAARGVKGPGFVQARRTDAPEDGGFFIQQQIRIPAKKPAAPPAPVPEREPPAGRMRDLWKLMLSGERVTADSFAKDGYSVGEAMNLLTMLEISGFVKSMPGGFYTRT